MNVPELGDKEVHVWVFGDPNPTCGTHCVGLRNRRRDLGVENKASPNPYARLVDAVRANYVIGRPKDVSCSHDGTMEREKNTALQVARAGAATLLCATTGQALGIDVKKIPRSSGEAPEVFRSLSRRTLITIKQRAVSHGLYPFAVLYAQRMAFARALKLRPHADMDRFNPLFKDTDDAYLRCGSWTRTIGGYLLRTIMIGGNYVGVICCSVLTSRLVMFDTMGRYADELLAPDDCLHWSRPENLCFKAE